MCGNSRKLKSLSPPQSGLKVSCFNRCKWSEWGQETLDSIPCSRRFLLLKFIRRTNGLSDYDEQSKSGCERYRGGFPTRKRSRNLLDESGERQERDKNDHPVRSLDL